MADHSSQAEIEQEPSSDLRTETLAQSDELIQHLGIRIKADRISDQRRKSD